MRTQRFSKARVPGAHGHSPEPGCMEDTGAPAWEGAPPRIRSDPRIGKHSHREMGHLFSPAMGPPWQGCDGSVGSQVLRPGEGPATHVGKRGRGGRKNTKMKSERSHYLSLALPLKKRRQRMIYSTSPNIQFPCYHITILR